MKFHWNLNFIPLSAGQNNKSKQIFIEIVNRISFPRCLANENFVKFFDNTFSYLLQLMFIKNIRFKSCFKSFEKKDEIESNFLNIPFGGLKLNHYLVQYGFDLMIQFGVISRCVKKLLSISPFVTKVQFVALKLILSISLCTIT